MRRALRAVVVVLSVTGIALGCGGRGPLDDAAAGAATDGDAAADGAALSEAGTDDVVDAGHEAGLLACGGCVLTTCGTQIESCIGSQACIGIFECLTTSCLAGREGGAGGLDTGCLLGCVGKDPGAALQILGVFQCITGTCGSDCGSVLGGLGGGLGGLGGLGGFGGGGKGAPIDGDALRDVLSPWPDLMSRE